MPHIFIFGLGYSAGFLAHALLADGWTVSGTCRDPSQADLLTSSGIQTTVFDRDHPVPDISKALTGVTHILSSVPPDELGDTVLECHGKGLAGLVSQLDWVGYLSTIGVYGDRQGGWVDEDSELKPVGERGQRRVQAERGWLSLYESGRLPVHIFRLAGIYGPGSNALERLRAGTARRIVKPGQVFSRIHVGDITQVLTASMTRPDPGRVYNVCDEEAAPPEEVVSHAARLLGVEPPPLVPIEEAGLSPMGLSFYGESKRVHNKRLTDELGVTLKYPTYREGLAALMDST